MPKVTPCLWFDGSAEEAATFYVSLLPGSRIENIRYLSAETPAGGRKGDVLSVEFSLAGIAYIALNGGPHYQFTPAVSFFISCDDQQEIDRLWAALGDGGKPLQCGWITDRFGLTWQVVPKILGELLQDSDPASIERVMKAMFQMVKLDIAALQAAGAG